MEERNGDNLGCGVPENNHWAQGQPILGSSAAHRLAGGQATWMMIRWCQGPGLESMARLPLEKGKGRERATSSYVTRADTRQQPSHKTSKKDHPMPFY